MNRIRSIEWHRQDSNLYYRITHLSVDNRYWNPNWGRPDRRVWKTSRDIFYFRHHFIIVSVRETAKTLTDGRDKVGLAVPVIKNRQARDLFSQEETKYLIIFIWQEIFEKEYRKGTAAV